MNRTTVARFLAVLLAGLPLASAAAPAAPAPTRGEEACLQNNRIWGWRAINERTLVVTDRNYRPFLVQLSGGCVGLNDAIFALRFRTWTNLGCLGQGDRVSFRAPALGPMSCFVRNVQPYRPAASDPAAERQEHRYESGEGG